MWFTVNFTMFLYSLPEVKFHFLAMDHLNIVGSTFWFHRAGSISTSATPPIPTHGDTIIKSISVSRWFTPNAPEHCSGNNAFKFWVPFHENWFYGLQLEMDHKRWITMQNFFFTSTLITNSKSTLCKFSLQLDDTKKTPQLVPKTNFACLIINHSHIHMISFLKSFQPLLHIPGDAKSS